MNYAIKGHSLMLAVALASCIRETPADEVLAGDGDLPGDEPADDVKPPFLGADVDLPAQADDDAAQEENRDARIATALAMYQIGVGRDVVCDWLADQCPQSIGTRERAAKALAGHNAGF